MPKYYMVYKFEHVLAPWAVRYHYEYFSTLEALENRKMILVKNPNLHDFQYGECYMKNGQLCPHC